MATLSDLERDIRRVAHELPDVARRANETVAREAKQLAVSLSSGVFKQRTFDTPVSRGGLGAPYGHGPEGWLGPRGPIPYGDPAVINAQTGLFRSAWRVYETGTMALLLNVAPYAGYLERGTTLMVRRPMDVYLNRFVEARGPEVFMEQFAALMRKRLAG